MQRGQTTFFSRRQSRDPHSEASSAKGQFWAEHSKPFGATDLAPFRREVAVRDRIRSKRFVQLVTNETQVSILLGTYGVWHSQLNTNTNVRVNAYDVGGLRGGFKERVF